MNKPIIRLIRQELLQGLYSALEDETPNARRNEERNPNRNHETVALVLFSHEDLKRAIQR